MNAVNSPAHAAGEVARAPLSRGVAVTVIAVALMAAVTASVFVGSQRLSVADVWSALQGEGGNAVAIVWDMRVPRTVMGLAVGAALGLAGALMQGYSRNPLADPGLLGVNAGASIGVVLGVGVFGFSTVTGYIWFAFAGAILATTIVYLIGSSGANGADPLRMTLAGVALAAVLGGVTSGITLLRSDIFNAVRAWGIGSLQALTPDVFVVLPFLACGVALAFLLAPGLNALALGDDLATALGTRVGLTRVGAVVAVTVLCGAATAAVGPIAFVGLMVPHAVRWLVGPHQVWILLGTVFAAPLLLLSADIVGRVLLPGGELPVGVVTAFVGAPVLIALVRRRKASGL